MEKLERRDIIKIAGGAVAGTAVGTLFSGAPFLGLQWLVEWTQDQPVPLAGEEKYLKGACVLCPSRCPLSVRMIGNRAVKVEAAGTGCFRIQNAIHLLYHPERIKYPLKRAGKKGGGTFAPVTWEEALKDIAAKTEELRAKGKTSAIAGISNGSFSLSESLLKRFVKAAGSPHFYTENGLAALSTAFNKTRNVAGALHYDLDNADYILSFGARLLEGWGDAAGVTKAFTGWKSRGARYTQIDTLCTRSASLADQWIPVKPGTEAVLAVGIARALIAMGKTSPGAGFARWAQIIINDYTPEKITEITGVSQETVTRIAKEFAGARNPVAVAGRGGQGVSSSTAEFTAVLALNSMVGSLGKQGGVMVARYNDLGEPVLDAAAAEGLKKAKLAAGLDDYIKNGEQFDILFINEANPVYRSPLGGELTEKMKKAGMVVAFMPLLNDTAAYADYVLPTITSLEGGPTAPRFKSMHPADILLSAAKRIKGLAGAFPWKTYADLLPLQAPPTPAAAAGFSFPVELFGEYLPALEKKLADKKHPLALIPFELPQVGNAHGIAGRHEHLVALFHQDAVVRGKKLLGAAGLLNREQARHQGRDEVDVPWQQAEAAVDRLGSHLVNILVHKDLVGEQDLKPHPSPPRRWCRSCRALTRGIVRIRH